ncbi:MAG: hypothetical protein PHW00_03480 [Clostridia bacterium]|nr:hypothetical protein [Clostridia bacterium]
MNKWRCNKCGNTNDGQYCTNCGQSKQESIDNIYDNHQTQQSYQPVQHTINDGATVPLTTLRTYQLLGSNLVKIISLLLSAVCVCYIVTIVSLIKQGFASDTLSNIIFAVISGYGSAALWGVYNSSRKGDTISIMRNYKRFSVYYIIRVIIGIISGLLMWVAAAIVLFAGGCLSALFGALSESFGGSGTGAAPFMVLAQMIAWIMFFIGVIILITYICISVTLSDVKRRVNQLPTAGKSRMFTGILMIIVGIYYVITGVMSFTGDQLYDITAQMSQSIIDEVMGTTGQDATANTLVIDGIKAILQSLIFLIGGVFVIKYSRISVSQDNSNG